MSFQEKVLQTAQEIDMRQNPFVVSLRAGRYEKTALAQVYVPELLRQVRSFLRSLSSILACCEHPEVRQHLLANLLEEEGAISFQPAEGLRIALQRRHFELARRFAQANGVAFEPSEPPRIASEWLVQELAQDCWLGPLAYVTVGQEAQSPVVFAELLAGFRQHYGFSEADLEFFSEHISADQEHCRRGAAMVEMVAITPALQTAALTGVRRAVAEMWQYYRVLDRKLRGCSASSR